MAKRISAADFVAFLKKRLAAKDGYIFGAVGQDPKKMSDWYFAGQYSGDQLKKALYWRENAQRVWDCNGLAEGYYKDVTGSSINARARDNYSEWCDPKGDGTIPVSYRVPGAAVFKRSSYIHHVGFLVEPVKAGQPEGDWYVIEAKGVMYGVIRSRLNSNDWNCWGLMTKYFDYSGEGGASTTPSGGSASTTPSGSSALGKRLLKKGVSGEDVRELQEILIGLGASLPKYGADGEYGSETQAAVRKLQAALGVSVDGIYGPKTHAALEAYLKNKDVGGGKGATQSPARIRVTASSSAYVRTGPGKNYPAFATVHHGEEYESPSAAKNGWRNLKVGSRSGWISPKMCEVI